MKNSLYIFLLLASFSVKAQDDIVKKIVDEATNNSQLELLAHELLDVVGPRLTGTPQMKKAGEWALQRYAGWGIDARIHEFGEWRGWERGVTHIDLIYPRVRTLSGMQLAYSPSTSQKGITAELAIIPEVNNKEEFTAWLKTIQGKFVLSSMNQVTGRPEYNWEKFATPESFEKMKKDKIEASRKWNANYRKMGVNRRNIIKTLEEAGAAGILSSNWAGGFGANRIFSAGTKKIPNIDLRLEDYSMLYRMVKNGAGPEIRVVSTSKDLGIVPSFNTLAEIKGVEKPEEYVILSAHFDSWDGATGATDNGTGTIVMMEAMRILKKIYPNPKRTIIAGHWGAEEQGLNGSSAFVEDNPEIVNNLQALFNQDNGTGRVTKINGHGFTEAYRFIGEWLEYVPSEIKNEIETTFPGVPIPRYSYEQYGVTVPSGGSSDWRNFVSSGVPGFNLSSLDFSYGGYSPYHYTWHTNRDTYDKIIFDDVRSNAILIAILTYLASEEEELMPRDRRVLPINPLTGEREEWPSLRIPNRDGSEDN